MNDSNASKVLLEELTDDGILTLTINRPDSMNSMNKDVVHQIWHRCYEIDGDDSVRVVILTGAGDKAFCAGADLKERKSMSEADVEQRLRDYRGCFRALEKLNKPVICAINGYAFGGGLEMALACDIRVVAQETKVGLTELGLGIIPGAGGTQRLPRLVGPAIAKEMMFTAARLTGDEAKALGVVNHSVPRANLMTFCQDMAKKMVRCAPVAVRQAKVAIDAGLQTDIDTGLELEAQAYAVTIPTQDRLEGLAAFAEKRDPVWQGK